MKIGGWDVEERVLVVAEIGNNHEGSMDLAKRLIGLAARAGAGAVKFQTIVPERLVAATQSARLAQLRRFQLALEDFAELARTAAEEGLLFLSTAFDLGSAAWLEPLLPAYKIASGDNDFWPLLEFVAATGKPILLSTGMSDLAGARRAKDFVEAVWAAKGLRGDLALLHCVAAYPTPADQANLLAIRALAGLGVTVGYSDHTLGVEAAALAVALGARIVEKHFTIDHAYSDFRDHQLAADPSELAELVARVRRAEELLGEPEKKTLACERPTAAAARRSLVAGRDLKAGSRLSPQDLDWLRPGGGLAPGQEARVLGKSLVCDLGQGEMILPEHLA